MKLMTQTDLERNPEIQAADAWFNSCMAKFRANGPFTSLEVISPARAQVLLFRNLENRTIVATHLKSLCASLRSGEWQMNGETIIVSETGDLNDGQHRLSAVIETGVPIATNITFGPTRASRKTVDMGAKRQAGHVLAMGGVKNSTLTAAALKNFLNLDAGLTLGQHRSSAQIEAAFVKYPDILVNFTPAGNSARAFKQSTGMFVALHYAMARSDRAKAFHFFQMLSDGVGIVDQNHPVARLRERLMKNLGGKAKLGPIDVAALVIKSWNAFRIGRKVEALRWSTEGANAETFPKVL